MDLFINNIKIDIKVFHVDDNCSKFIEKKKIYDIILILTNLNKN